jgi:hypothetical protein
MRTIVRFTPSTRRCKKFEEDSGVNATLADDHEPHVASRRDRRHSASGNLSCNGYFASPYRKSIEKVCSDVQVRCLGSRQRTAVQVIKDLNQRGILHSIASKNNAEEALTALEYFGIREIFSGAADQLGAQECGNSPGS